VRIDGVRRVDCTVHSRDESGFRQVSAWELRSSRRATEPFRPTGHSVACYRAVVGFAPPASAGAKPRRRRKEFGADKLTRVGAVANRRCEHRCRAASSIHRTVALSPARRIPPAVLSSAGFLAAGRGATYSPSVNALIFASRKFGRFCGIVSATAPGVSTPAGTGPSARRRSPAFGRGLALARRARISMPRSG
jgi:hypothetical protein